MICVESYRHRMIGIASLMRSSRMAKQLMENKTPNTMRSFTLKLDNVTYECSGNQYSKKDQNWAIQAQMEGMRVCINIPIESKLTTCQVMAFVERLHEGMSEAKKEQKSTVEYV